MITKSRVIFEYTVLRKASIPLFFCVFTVLGDRSNMVAVSCMDLPSIYINRNTLLHSAGRELMACKSSREIYAVTRLLKQSFSFSFPYR
jgi:hypothetical protein